MSRFWMVRAGEGGTLIDDFQRTATVAIGWGADFTKVRSLDEMKILMERLEPDKTPQGRASAANTCWKFRTTMQKAIESSRTIPNAASTCLAPSPATTNTSPTWFQR